MMKNHSILIAVTTLTLAAPAVIHSAQSDPSDPLAAAQAVVQPDAPRAGLVTIVDLDLRTQEAAKRRIAWKSLAALPSRERARLLGLVEAVDFKANRPRAPFVATPICMESE